MNEFITLWVAVIMVFGGFLYLSYLENKCAHIDEVYKELDLAYDGKIHGKIIINRCSKCGRLDEREFP